MIYTTYLLSNIEHIECPPINVVDYADMLPTTLDYIRNT